MTRRERILAALSGGVPDRPPLTFDAHGQALAGAMAHYGARNKNDLYLKAGIDGFSVWEWNAVMGRYAGPPKPLPDGTATDFWGNASQHGYGLYACDTVADLARHRWPCVADFDFSHIRERVRTIRAMDMVVSAGHIGLGYQMHNMLRGNEKALFDVTDDDYMQAYEERLLAFTLDYLRALLEAGGGDIEVVRADDDVGTMDRLMVSPEMWRRFYKPAWKQAFALVRSYGAKVWFHSCGYIWPLLEDLIEIGVDCWNPFPPYVKDNEHAHICELRRHRLALDGGVNQIILVNGTPAEVKVETQRVLELFAPDGGLLIGPSQVFTEDIPTANIVALFDTVLDYRTAL